MIWALLSGLLYGLAQPGWGIWPLGWVCLVPLLHTLRGKGATESFLLGLSAGTVAFLSSVYWIVVAVNRYGAIPLPIALPILLLLSLYLGSYWGLYGLGTSWMMATGPIRGTVGPAALWVLLEYLRGHLFGGFPWALLAHSHWKVLAFIQICDITGAYGLSFLLAAGSAAFALVLERHKGAFRAVAFVTISSLGVLLYGWAKLKEPLPEPSLRVGIVQGNVEQNLKWDEAYSRQILTIHKELTLRLISEAPTMVIWPETAFPDYFPEGELSEAMRQVAKEARRYLLFGSLRRSRGRVYNSAFLLSPEGEVMGWYDKLHLVPFGEFIPMRRYLEPIFGQLASLGDITPGQEMTLFHLPGGDFSVLICFEVIFPELSRLALRRGADFLVTITNDAWFGRTAAPYQHMAQVVFRAVEGRVWIARAANTGISGVVDPKGRIVRATELFSKEAFTALVGKTSGLTLYCRLGDWFVLLAGAIFIASASLRRPNRDRSSSPGVPGCRGRP
ncbi:MAG TPA: apolipoprotein N-acyltransferase [Deltaproteobacteria bacterium]|nr:apolipoprotein N-acyltransferase [Deltaproteobacteria bacterium]